MHRALGQLGGPERPPDMNDDDFIHKRGTMRRTLPGRCAAIGLVTGLALVLGFSTPDAPSNVAAQSGGTASSMLDRFVGTWKLVSIEQRNAKGDVVPPAAATPPRVGYLIYDRAGYMAVSIMPANRKRNAGPQVTDDEAKGHLEGYTAYFGTTSFDPGGQFVIHRLQGSLNPGMAVEQKRFYELSGNRLTLKPPPGANGNQARLTWERMPEVATITPEHKKFIGFWKLVSNERRDDKGTLVGSNPGQTGYIIYTAAGFMMVHMVQPNRKPFAGAQPTPAEAGQALRTYTNYFGPFHIHESDGYVVHDQVGTANMGRIGPSPQQRWYTFKGNQLLLQPPPAFAQGGPTVQGTITWQKVDPAVGAH